MMCCSLIGGSGGKLYLLGYIVKLDVACFSETWEAYFSCCIDRQQTVHSWHYPSLSHVSILI